MNQKYSLPVKYVDSRAELDRALVHLRNTPVLALDTEFKREDTYFPQLCLLQIATADSIFLIDNLAIGNIDPLVQLLVEPSRLKVLHSARQDLELFCHLGNQVPAPVFDTQIAAACLGDDLQLGYSSLVEKRLEIRVDKSQTRTRWYKRPLTRAQLDYAIEDVLYLIPLMKLLEKDLRNVKRLAWFYEDSEELYRRELYLQDPGETWQRVKGIGRLAHDELPRLVKLAAWREVTARQDDLPKQWLIRDSVLVEIARAAPRNISQLEYVADMPKKITRRYGFQIIEAMQQPSDDSIVMPDQDRLGAREKNILKSLRQVLESRAAALDVKPELLAGRKELQAIARGKQSGLRVLNGWRMEILGRDLLAAFAADAQNA